jgi:hypothetical protein
MSKNILTAQEKKLYKTQRLHILQFPGIREVVVLLCICSDAFTLYNVFDLMLTQQVNLTLIITITVAACMNICPMLLAACLRNDELKQNMKNVICISLSTVFIVLFIFTFALRFTSRNLLFNSTSELSIETSAAIDEVEEEENKTTLAEDILAILLGLEPLATSAVSFVLGYESSLNRKREHLLSLYNIKLQQEINSNRVMLRELEEDMKFDLDAYDTEQYEKLKEIIMTYGEQAKVFARVALAQKEATPEAVEYLMEGGYNTFETTLPIKKESIAYSTQKKISA